MRLVCFVLFVGLFMVACQQQPQSQSSGAPTPAPAPADPPPVPNTPPPVPPTPSARFVKGYNDGFYGTWLATIRWTFADEYRSGWSLGAYDRHHQHPHRYVK